MSVEPMDAVLPVVRSRDRVGKACGFRCLASHEEMYAVFPSGNAFDGRDCPRNGTRQALFQCRTINCALSARHESDGTAKVRPDNPVGFSQAPSTDDSAFTRKQFVYIPLSPVEIKQMCCHINVLLGGGNVFFLLLEGKPGKGRWVLS